MKIVAALVIALLASTASCAMTFEQVGGTLIMSGPVVGNDLARLKDHLAAGPVQLVLLHESSGGDLWNGEQLAHRIRSENLPTAVAGKCESACGLIFLGGVERSFSDGRPLRDTMVGLHGAHHPVTWVAMTDKSPRMAWLIRSWTDGRYPASLAERTVYPQDARDVVYVFHPMRFPGASKPKGVMECRVQPAGDYACTMFEGMDALSIGVVTNPQVLELDAAVKQRLAERTPN